MSNHMLLLGKNIFWKENHTEHPQMRVRGLEAKKPGPKRIFENFILHSGTAPEPAAKG